MNGPPTSRGRWAVALLGVGLGVGVACAPARRRDDASTLALGHRVAAEVEARGRAEAPTTPAAAPTAPRPAPWADPLFSGMEGIALLLRSAEGLPAARPGVPFSGRAHDFERRARVAFAEEGRRDVGCFYVLLGVSHVDLPPAACAERLLDAEREREALDAQALVERVRSRQGDVERRVLAVDMLRKGEGPFVYDFRWDFVARRRDRPDGAILLRYDLTTRFRAPEHVSFFAGAAVLTPEGAGTRWVEVLAVASDLSPPFFLRAKVDAAVAGILGNRWIRLSR